MLVLHWFVTPFVMCQWVNWPSWVFLLTLLQVLIFWALYFTAVEIEFPFNPGNIAENNYAQHLQMHFNEHLLVLISPISRLIPTLSEQAQLDVLILSGEHQIHEIGDQAELMGKQPGEHARTTAMVKLSKEMKHCSTKSVTSQKTKKMPALGQSPPLSRTRSLSALAKEDSVQAATQITSGTSHLSESPHSVHGHLSAGGTGDVALFEKDGGKEDSSAKAAERLGQCKNLTFQQTGGLSFEQLSNIVPPANSVRNNLGILQLENRSVSI